MPTSAALESDSDQVEHALPLGVVRPASTRSAIPSVDTPVMRQYLEIKERYPDCILFFRLGDFYEMFFDDAVEASQLLDLTLTARDKQKEVPVPMCGVPYHAARGYIGRLIAHGKKVAICDQMEDARKTKKIVRRAVTQVVTPGVVLEEDQLEPKSSNYLCALCPGSSPSDRAGLAYLDVSTGEFAACELPESEALDELCRIEPAELLLVEDQTRPQDSRTAAWIGKIALRLKVPTGQAQRTDPQQDLRLLTELIANQAQVSTEHTATLTSEPLLTAAAAACLRYARATQPTGGLPIVALRLYKPTDCMVLDDATKTNLELLQTLLERKRQGSLLGVVDQTKTAMGGRLLRNWLLQPLLDLAMIGQRHDAVEWLALRQATRQALRDVLKGIHDIERLTGRLTTLLATPRDLYCLGHSLRELPRLMEILRAARNVVTDTFPIDMPYLLSLGTDLAEDVAATIEHAIADNPPAQWRDGGFLRRGYHAELDELADLSQGGKQHILRIEERERERTGISSLKVRYNKVFGYFIEITRSNLTKVPADYVRKQTTVNGERFVTDELSEYEAKVLHAEERRVELELQLYESLRQSLATQSSRLLKLAQRVATLDVLGGLGELAHRSGYTRPTMTRDLRLQISEGRHPVIEQLRERGTFVPNDITLDPDNEQILVLTGPNMAGKSTVMRQVALICILAQMGSFVPAAQAELGLVDRVLTRVGATDNLSRGDSTFMVEMRETSNILKRATRRSLVVLDEIGRGTSTYDGLSIAWAVAEYLHDVAGCKTLFATHYHELTALAAARPRVRNAQVAIRQYQDEIVFLHKLLPGGANRSYGIEVARLAGLPAPLLHRAREILSALESQASSQGTSSLPAHGVPPLQSGQLSLLLGGMVPIDAAVPPAPPPPKPPRAHQEVLDQLLAADPEELSPRAAHDLLRRLTLQLRVR